ncbi:metal ABC transporter substrate-binding protein [Thermodesulfobacteriota bacterium]
MKIRMPFCYGFCFIFFLIIQLQATPSLAKKLPVIASIYPIADMIQQVGGDHVEVTYVLPAGASPHTFEPKPSLLKKFSTARIFFMVGAGLEFWAEKFVVLTGPGLMTVVLSEGVDLIDTTGHTHHNHDHQKKLSDVEDRSIIANPHIWLDPVIAKSMAKKIMDALCEIDHQHLTYYKQRGQNYLKELDKLHRRIEATVASFKIKKYVSFHASWDYFARRYGLESVGVIEAAPGRNPTPIQIKNIVAMIKKYHIRAVFAEPQLNARAAEIIAREADVKALFLDPMGGPKQKNVHSYIDLMSYNIGVFKEAME